MKIRAFVILIIPFFLACNKKSTIKVENYLSQSLVRNVEWGGMPISSAILPGETSREISIYAKDSYYEFKLPESFPLKFYVEVNGDKVYLQTRESYNLDKEENLIIRLEDTTPVFNPLIISE